MNKKSKLRPYATIANGIVMLVIMATPQTVEWYKLAVIVGSFVLVGINYLDGHLETKD